MILMEERHLQIVRNILSKYPYKFYAFGSRVTGNAKKFSDLDLCYKESIPDNIVSHIEGEFEDSDLPFKIDLLSWERCLPEFRKTIDSQLTLIA
ncbi:MAG: nucleotidyltransferase domain-containing protein [Deltaproteobacteria bacterium]|nr:nucleotidyltransferase domain-containing protein [Deltaproteobacteria bacterium]